MLNKENITIWLKSLQDSICKALETEDGLAKFKEEEFNQKNKYSDDFESVI